MNKDIDAPEFGFKYKYSHTYFLLKISENCFVIETEMSYTGTIDDILSSKVGYFRDALLKAVMIYRLKYPDPIDQQRLTVSIDGTQKVLFDKSKNNNLPLVYSMLDEKLFRPFSDYMKSDEIINWYINKAKSSYSDAISAYFAYLYSKTKEYESEKFFYLWIAMNGFCNGIYQAFIKKYGKFKKYTKNKSGIIKYINKDKDLTESEIIWLTSVIFGLGKKSIPQKQSELIARNVISVFRDCKHTEYNKKMFDDKDLSDRIKSKVYSRENPPDDENKRLKNTVYSPDPFDITPYGYTLLWLSYYIRCTRFHANKPIILLCLIDDHDMRCLTILNCLIEEFLEENFHYLINEKDLNALLEKRVNVVRDAFDLPKDFFIQNEQ